MSVAVISAARRWADVVCGRTADSACKAIAIFPGAGSAPGEIMDGKRAADIMTQPVVTIAPGALLVDAMKLLLRHHLGSLPVVNSADEMIGIISQYDIMNFALSGTAADTRVEEAMSTEVISFPPEAEMSAVMQCLVSRRLHRVPIVKDSRVVGIVSRRDVLREMLFLYSKYR
jgi:CBS domain-containing protein